MDKPSKSAERLHELIKKAIADGQITQLEREKIMMIADEDHVIDKQEQKLLAELQNLIDNGTIKVVPG